MKLVNADCNGAQTCIDKADEVLSFLNAKTGKHYAAKNPRGTPTANAEAVIGRLKEGYTTQDCKSVIAMKCREWLGDERMSKFLRPATLFCRANFEQYIGEIGAEDGLS